MLVSSATLLHSLLALTALFTVPLVAGCDSAERYDAVPVPVAEFNVSTTTGCAPGEVTSGTATYTLTKDAGGADVFTLTLAGSYGGEPRRLTLARLRGVPTNQGTLGGEDYQVVPATSASAGLFSGDYTSGSSRIALTAGNVTVAETRTLRTENGDVIVVEGSVSVDAGYPNVSGDPYRSVCGSFTATPAAR